MERPRTHVPILTHWPDQPDYAFLPTPKKKDDLLAYWEWVLWTRYRQADLDGADEWKAHAKTFWERLATCEQLIELCRKQPSLHVHRVLTWLFTFSDMVERKTIEGAFDFQQHKQEDRTWQIKRAHKNAANLEQAQALVHRMPREYFSPDQWKTWDQLFTQGLDHARAEAGEGPISIVFSLSVPGKEKTVVISPTAPTTPAAPTKRRGKPAFTGGALNLYLALLVDLLEEIPGSEKHEELAMSLLRHFTPPHFQKTKKEFKSETLRLTVHYFRDQGTTKDPKNKEKQARKEKVAEKLTSLRAWLDTPAVRELCPAPPFLLYTPSSSVADRPR